MAARRPQMARLSLSLSLIHIYGVTRYRTLLNDGQTYPDYVDDTQKGVMERCLTLVTDVMAVSYTHLDVYKRQV